MAYEVTFSDDTITTVQAAAYRQEGSMLTFYRTDVGRRTIDCWSVPVASFRTAKVDRVLLVGED